ncbi:UPF0481 protein At3g47200-like [Neltuma alba]|uniref:UPF0481 protein At3g47200-like n=1 Tax=Neltuma alba TaxID=207710 RepID=UPI0010A2E32A|nr:UPF0481 protein At3g47200-like [Prosopis alba]
MPGAGTQYKDVHDPDDKWIADIETALGCVHDDEVKTGSICRVPEKIRRAEGKGYSYRPKLVAMGPFHRGTRSDLQINELTKWQFMHSLLAGPTQNNSSTLHKCSKAIKEIGSIIRASYGEKIEMGEEEFARMMLLDGCYLLEFLLRLTKHEERVDQKYVLQVLTDLTLLENQIPFVVLTTLSSILFELLDAAEQPKLASLCAPSQQQVGHKVKLSPKNTAQSLFECNDDFPEGVYHFLHLIHLCSPDPYREEQGGKDPLKLQRCARKLQALGITIKAKATQTNDAQGDDQSEETAASVLRKFVDKFEFKIEFNKEERELTIPPLHIKERTQVKWRNLIAWEQIGLPEVGYKFTSYAYFFKGLVCSVHDLKLLKQEGVIKVDNEAIKDEDLVKMFQTITTGAEQRDGRYGTVCQGLNAAEWNGMAGCCALMFRMPWHYWRRFLEWLQHGLMTWLRTFVDIYLGTPWKIVGVIVGAIVLALTITQTVYAVRDPVRFRRACGELIMSTWMLALNKNDV